MSNENSFTSRRQFMSTVGLAAAAGSVSPSAGARETKPTAQPLMDPGMKYPEPPFKEQTQPWPVSPARWTPNPITAKDL